MNNISNKVKINNKITMHKIIKINNNKNIIINNSNNPHKNKKFLIMDTFINRFKMSK